MRKILQTNLYLQHVMHLLSPLGEVSVRAMFGGHGIYWRGVMFALVMHDELYFKVGARNLVEYKAAGSRPFMYAGKHNPVTMSYWHVPAAILENDALLKQWALAAHQVAQEAKHA